MKQKGTKLYITLFTLQLKIIAALVYYIKTKENLKLSRQYQNKIYLKTKFSLNDRIMYIQYNNYISTKEKLSPNRSQCKISLYSVWKTLEIYTVIWWI